MLEDDLTFIHSSEVHGAREGDGKEDRDQY